MGNCAQTLHAFVSSSKRGVEVLDLQLADDVLAGTFKCFVKIATISAKMSRTRVRLKRYHMGPLLTEQRYVGTRAQQKHVKA